jgi:serine/threonine-protein kinase
VTVTTPGAGDVLAGRYLLQGPVGSGRFATVFAARDRERDELVAVKLLRPERAHDARAVARFAHEEAVLALLEHPGAVRLLATGEHSLCDGGPPCPFMVQELVRGLPLSAILDLRGPLPVAEAAPVVAQVLDCLQQAHLAGVLHRDLKPHNLLVVAPRGRWTSPRPGVEAAARLGIPDLADPLWGALADLEVKLLDFGLAKRFNAPQPRRLLPVRGQATGATCYMAPEQLNHAQALDQRADVYGAAMLLFRLLVGHPPFVGATRAAIAQQHLEAPLPPLPPPLTDHPVAAVFARAAARDRDERFATAAEMAWQLRAAVSPRVGGAAPPAFARPEAPSVAGWLSGWWPLHRRGTP